MRARRVEYWSSVLKIERYFDGAPPPRLTSYVTVVLRNIDILDHDQASRLVHLNAHGTLHQMFNLCTLLEAAIIDLLLSCSCVQL